MAATPTLVCFFIGTQDEFAADAASATSFTGIFVAATSGVTTLHGALNAATASFTIAACTPLDQGERPAAGLPSAGFMWTLQDGGAI